MPRIVLAEGLVEEDLVAYNPSQACPWEVQARPVEVNRLKLGFHQQTCHHLDKHSCHHQHLQQQIGNQMYMEVMYHGLKLTCFSPQVGGTSR